jgi:hypothetical protein
MIDKGDGEFAKWLNWECCPKCKVKMRRERDVSGCKIYRCIACRMRVVDFKESDDEQV